METRNSHFKTSVQLALDLNSGALLSKMSKLLFSVIFPYTVLTPTSLIDVSYGSVYIIVSL